MPRYPYEPNLDSGVSVCECSVHGVGSGGHFIAIVRIGDIRVPLGLPQVLQGTQPCELFERLIEVRSALVNRL